MKKYLNKKILLLMLIGLLSVSVVGFFIYYVVRTKANSEVAITETAEFENGKVISLSDFDKFYVVQRDGSDAYFLIDNFKAVFLQKLIATNPVSDNFHLMYQTNDEIKPTEIKVTYTSQTKNDYFWGYKITF